MREAVEAGHVGIIGVGKLGLAIAERLRHAGLDVCGYRRSSLESFTALGGTALPSARTVALNADPVFLLLPDDTALVEIIDEIASVLRQGQTVICLGTHPVGLKRQALERVEARHAHFLEAEVSGTPDMIRTGKGSVMVTGASPVIESVLSLLEVAVGPVTRLDSFGDAARVKLIANYLVSVHTLAAADALIMGRHLGLVPDQLLRALTSSAAASVMLAIRGPMMLQLESENANSAGGNNPGRSGLAGFMRYFELLRDSLGQEVADRSGLLAVTERLFQRTVELDSEAQDLSAVYRTLQDVSPSAANAVDAPEQPTPAQ